MKGSGRSDASYDIGPYRLLGILRQEGPMLVCAAVHRPLGTIRVVKLVPPGVMTAALVKQFVRHARAIAAAEHPVLLGIFECGRLPSGGAFVVMERVEGEPADEWLRRLAGRGTEPSLAGALVGTVADACAHLGRQRVVHGDLRPGNLRLVRDPLEPRRFSVKLVGSEDAEAALLTPSARRPGLPYLAPEQWCIGSVFGPRADIYALGCLFFELLAGRPPFLGGDESELSLAHRQQDPPDLAALVPGVSVALTRLIGRMLAKAPERRYQTMAEIVTALELILGRHRTRFGELLRAPENCLVRDTIDEDEEALLDLTPVTLALARPAVERLVGRAFAALQPVEVAVRDTIARAVNAILGHRSESPPPAGTVLVAEDDEDTRASIVELLEDHGYRVVAARHGGEARDYLRTGQGAECMVMDLWMPEMDGWTLAAEMKGGRLPEVPTIVVTAAEPHLGYPSPIVIRKPFDSLELLDLVRTMSAARRTTTPGPP